MNSPTGDVVGPDVLAQHVAVAHVAGGVHGDALEVDVVGGFVGDVHVAEAGAARRQLPPQGRRVQVAPGARLGADEAAGVGPGRVPVAHGGRVPGLQPRAGLAQPPGQRRRPPRQAEDAAAADLGGDVGVERGLQCAVKERGTGLNVALTWNAGRFMPGTLTELQVLRNSAHNLLLQCLGRSFLHVPKETLAPRCSTYT